MIHLTVDDPGRLIASINVLHESDEAVVLAIDLNGAAKRQTPIFQGRCILFGMRPPFTEITIHGDDLGESPLTAAETARHTCIITLARRREGRKVWRDATSVSVRAVSD